MEKILEIKEITGLKLGNWGKSTGNNGSQLGISQMINALCGYGEYDGYLIKTDEHEYHILIDNGQSCCESWGYFSSEDDFDDFIHKELKEVRLTDTALNQKVVENVLPYGLDYGGIQFVDFVMVDGDVLQFAVYNEHNGYYGHSILVAKDAEILLSDTL